MVDIAVSGLGIITALGRGIEQNIEGLCRHKDVFAPWPPFEAAHMRTPMAAALPMDLHAQQPRDEWLLLDVIKQVLVDAGLPCDGTMASVQRTMNIAPERIALVTGTSSSGIGAFCRAMRESGPPSHTDARYSATTERVARQLHFAGPVLTICSVCASGALAIAEAADMLEQRTVDVAIAAGFDPLEPFVGQGFDVLGALAQVPMPFRAGRQGLVLGEGAAALLLVRADAPWLRGRVAPHGYIRGWGRAADAYHLTAPDPRGQGVSRAIAHSLACARLPSDAIDAVNAHGTATPYNDAMECAALRLALGSHARTVPVYTVKGTIGHTLGAAGAIEAVVALAAMRAKIVPPTRTSGAVDPQCEINLVEHTLRDHPTHATLSLSSAFGGANCALVLSDQPRAPTGNGTETEAETVVRCVAQAFWISGHFVDTLAAFEDHEARTERGVVRPLLDLEAMIPGERIARSDRTTQLAALVLGAVLPALKKSTETRDDRLGIITASVVATAHTNERFELRRMSARTPEPRVFPYTAPNASAGELSIALGAQGPSLTLVGGIEVSLIALERAGAWIKAGVCDRVVVIAVECPPDRSEIVAPATPLCEAAAVMVLARTDHGNIVRVFPSAVPEHAVCSTESPALCVAPMVQLALSDSHEVTIRAPSGCAWHAVIRTEFHTE